MVSYIFVKVQKDSAADVQAKAFYERMAQISSQFIDAGPSLSLSLSICSLRSPLLTGAQVYSRITTGTSSTLSRRAQHMVRITVSLAL
jgi:hypothetical protein